MELTINGKEYRLYFGTDFVDYINKANGMELEGVKTNVGGMLMLNAGLSMKAPSTLELVIKASTNTLPSKPSNYDLEEYINDLLDQEDDTEYEELFAEIEAEIKKRPANRREMGISKAKKGVTSDIDYTSDEIRAIAIARFDLTPLETLRMTQYEFHMYLLAHQIKAQEAELLSAKQAWFNQLAKATKKVGKEMRSAYKSFDDFYDNSKAYKNIFEPQEEKENVRKLTIADMNRRINSKGG